MRHEQALLIAASLAIGACTIEDPGTRNLPSTGELVDFATYVQPLLQAGCASLDCHGNAGRPLRLYARNGLRTEIALRGQDASDEEMLANMSAINGLDPANIQSEDRLLLLKPLSVDAGGLHHIGGDLWPDANDGIYRCLHAWLGSGVSDEAGRATCMQVLP